MTFKYTGVIEWGVIHVWDVAKVEAGYFKHGNTITLKDGKEYVVKETGLTKHPYYRDAFSLDVYFEEKR